MALAPKIMQPAQDDPLAGLRDIHLPLDVDFYYLAPGWWILGILSLVTIIVISRKGYQQWLKQRYRKTGIKALEASLGEYQRDRELPAYLSRYAIILKRVALSAYPREEVASLTGEAWVNFLDKTFDGQDFSMGAGQILIDGPYQSRQQFNVEDIHKLGVSWVRRHKISTLYPSKSGNSQLKKDVVDS